jgi:hypothetical protein
MFYPILSFMKKYEQSNGLNVERIEQLNDVMRDALLAEFDRRLK